RPGFRSSGPPAGLVRCGPEFGEGGGRVGAGGSGVQAAVGVVAVGQLDDDTAAAFPGADPGEGELPVAGGEVAIVDLDLPADVLGGDLPGGHAEDFGAGRDLGRDAVLRDVPGHLVSSRFVTGQPRAGGFDGFTGHLGLEAVAEQVRPGVVQP